MSEQAQADIMRESALQDAKVKRWQGWDWKAYQTSIIRQNYKIRDAQRLADACKAARKANNCTPDVDKLLDEALAQWKGEKGS